MTYDISAISNRDLQLLYQYRILRQPSDKLTAILTGDSVDANLRFEGETDDGMFEYFINTNIPDNLIPFIEFDVKQAKQWTCLASLVYADITDKSIRVYSTSEIDTTIQAHIYWCPSLHMIESVLNDTLSALTQLSTDLESLSQAIGNLEKYGGGAVYAEGLATNLVKIAKKDNKNTLVDAEYRIETAEAERLYVNLSQYELDSMIHTFNKCVEFRFVDNEKHILQNFSGPIMSITGNGVLILRNIKSQVIISGFKGSIVITDCPEVHIQANSNTDICNIDELRIIRNSCVYIENRTHYIDKLYLMLNSTVRHRRGFVKTLEWVGYGCTYWCTYSVWVPGINYLEGIDTNKNTIYDFDVLHILGTLQQDESNFLIHNTRCVGFKVANSDAPSGPVTAQCEWEAEYSGGGGGDTPIPPTPVTGNSPRDKIYNWFAANTPFSKEVICGILGNMQQESNFDPFVHGSYYGLWQTDDVDLRTAMNNAGLSYLWHTLPTWSSWEGHCTEEQWNTAVNVQLQVLKDSHYGGVGFTSSANYFENNLDKVTNSSGVAGTRSYCELFCALCERCVGGSDTILDPIVYDFIMNTVYNHADYKYQELAERREYAVTAYSEIG